MTTFLMVAAVAQAQPAGQAAPAPEPTVAPSEAQPDASPPADADAKVGGWQFLASFGFGPSTSNARQLELSPYGTSFGLDAGFTFPIGFRLGAYGGYSLGRSVTENKDPRIGVPFDFDATASSLNTGLSLGWDVPVHFLLLRYGLGLGATSMKWDMGTVDPRRVGWGEESNPAVGFHFAQRVDLLWPHGLFEGGVGIEYLLQVNPAIPDGFIGKLIAGVKL